MERHRGHFYNWYDTRDLTPLLPRYVSTVDSGNLAACLLAVKQGCLELVHAPVIGPARWDGLLDTLDILSQVIERRVQRQDTARFSPLRTCVETMREEAVAIKGQRRAWGPGIARLLQRGVRAMPARRSHAGRPAVGLRDGERRPVTAREATRRSA